MNVVPKFYQGHWNPERQDFDDSIGLRTLFAAGSRGEPGGVWVECEVVYPASSNGRTVHLFLDDEVSEALMKDLRERAIQRRSKPLDA